MNVRELIEYLEQYDDNTEVVMSFGSGDYWGTVVATGVNDAYEGYVSYSDYHRKYKVSEDENEDTKMVIILE